MARTNVSLNLLKPPALATELIDDNSLLNDNILKETTDEENEQEDAVLEADVDMIVIESDIENEIDDDGDSDSDDEDEEVKNLKEFQNILNELESNQYAYDKYVRLCELSQ